MKKFTKDDFKTFFARQQAEQELMTINWEVLDRYADTDILPAVKIAVYDMMQSTGQIPDELPDDHPGILLSNDDIVDAETANNYARAHGQYTYLRTLKIFEDTFSETTDLKKIIRDFSNGQMPPAGELNFPLVIKMYPAEATHIYFQFRFADEMKDGFAYSSISGYLNQNLIGNNIGPGPTNIDALEALGLMGQGWQNMALDIEGHIIPELEEARKPDGNKPPFN